MLTNCQNCQFYSEPAHPSDLACAIAPTYSQMWQHLKGLPTASLHAMPIDACRDFNGKAKPFTAEDFQIRTESIDDVVDLANAIALSSVPSPLKDVIIWENHPAIAPFLTRLQPWQIAAAVWVATDSTPAAPPRSPPQYDSDCAIDPIDMILVESSNVEAIGYVADESLLYVRFHNGLNYCYLDVPQYQFEQFLAAPSKGRFLNSNIKPHYFYDRLARSLNFEGRN